MYYKGEGVSKNYSKAMNLFLDASFMGHPASQINVGNMYYFGEGVGKNYPKAHMWWSLAKEKGVDAAFSNLTMIENKMTNSQLLEAQKLFNLDNYQLDIIIHPNSLVHAIIKLKNGLIKFIYHETSMIIPISNAIFEKNHTIESFLKKKKITRQMPHRKFDFSKSK